FPRRMFEYHVAIRQLYNQEVASLAVLCDDRPSWRPTTFNCERWGCRIDFTFRMAKLLDWLPDLEALDASDNPVAAVVGAHLEAMQSRGDPVRRMHAKLRLAKGLLKRSWSAEDIRQLLRLIDWLMTLPEDMEEAFRTDFHKIEKESVVPFVTTFERYGIKK